MEASIWLVDPFPLVPATWMVFIFFSGCPKWAQMANVLSKLGLMAAAPILLNKGSLVYR